MEATSEEALIEVIRLKRHLYQLKIKGEISLAHYTQLNSELDFLSYRFVEEVSSGHLPELVNTLAKRYPDIRFAVLEPTLTKQRIELIRGLRKQAIDAGQSLLVVDRLFENIGQIPLRTFSWQAFIDHHKTLQLSLQKPSLSDTELLAQGLRLFGTHPDTDYFGDAQSLQKNIFRKLIMERFIAPDQVEGLQRDEETLRNSLSDRERSLLREGLVVPNPAYSAAEQFNYLMHSVGASNATADLQCAVLQWQGPGLHLLLQKMLAQQPKSRLLTELILARTGIHPQAEATEWQAWLTREQSRQGNELAEVQRLRQGHGVLYDIFHVISLRHLSGDSQALLERWLPIAQRIVQKNHEDKLARTVSSSPMVAEKNQALGATSAVELNHTEDGQVEPLTDDSLVADDSFLDTDALANLDAEDIAGLNAPTAQFKRDDRVVARHSPWNKYVKPFLSENWLALIGIGFIMAAWPILSMMVWDLGEYYRLAAGAVPLLFITLGSAWITDFFAKLNNPAWQTEGTLQSFNRKPVQLFSCLTVWTLPFNVLMAVSMIDAHNLVVGVLLLLVYAGTMTLIGPWLRGALGANATGYLIQSHLLLLLPALLKVFAPTALTLGLSVMAYGVFLFFVKTLFAAIKNQGLFSLTFLCLLYAGHAFLGLASSHIFYQQLPTLGTVAVLCELGALSLLLGTATAGAKSASTLILAGALTLLGMLLGLADAAYLPVILMLSGSFWFAVHVWKRNTATAPAWVMEVFALHPILLAVSLYYLLELGALLSFALAGAVVASLLFVENRFARQELRLLSWGLPLSLCLAAAILGAADWLGLSCFAVLMFASLVNYLRAVRLYHTGLWFVAVLVCIALPPLFFAPVISADALGFSSYMALVSVAWTLLANKLGGGMVRNHGTTVAWLLIAVAGSFALIAAASLAFQWHLGLAMAMLGVGIASIFAAKRSQSALPVYFAVLQFVVLGLGLKYQLDLHSRSGLGSAIVALIFLYLAPQLQRQPLLAAKLNPDRFFNKPFFFCSERYLQAPIEHCAWLILAISMTKATLAFSPVLADPKVTAAYILQCIALLSLANRYRLSWVAGLGLLPFGLCLAAICLTFPEPLQAVVAMLMLVAVYYLNTWMQRWDILHNVLRQPLALAQTCVSYLFIPAGLIGYGVLLVVGAGPWSITAFVALSLYYLQKQFVLPGRYVFIHLSILHVCIFWTLTFVFVQPGILTAGSLPLAIGLPYVLGLFTLLFVIAYIMEWFDNSVLAAYRQRAQYWLIGFALLALVVMSVPVITDLGRSAVHGILALGYGLVVLHLGNRYFHALSLYFCKWLGCWLVLYVVLNDVLWSALLSAYLYLLFEGLWHMSTKLPLLQLQGVGECWQTPVRKLAWVAVAAVVTTLVVHWLSMITGYHSTMSPAWFFALLPLTAWLYHVLRWPALGVATAIVFVYANIFVALQWRAFALANGLTSVHLVNAALLFSIFCFIVLLRFFPRSALKEPSVDFVPVTEMER